jgi:hypothetical protein
VPGGGEQFNAEYAELKGEYAEETMFVLCELLLFSAYSAFNRSARSAQRTAGSAMKSGWTTSCGALM